MPAKNRTKQYLENSYYHIYNRGNEKRPIFRDQQDYGVFLSYLKEYLVPKDEKELQKKLADPLLTSRERNKIVKLLQMNNFANEITLLTYGLMPNHFHLLIKQKSAESIDRFMNSLGTRYTMYFNPKYKRVGSLYQGVYKAVLVSTDEQLVHLSRYIHKQTLASQGQALQDQPSSYPEYLGERKTKWVHSEQILSYFSKTNPTLSYRSFVEQEEDLSIIRDIIIED